MTRKEVITYIALRTFGNFLLLFALYGVGATFGPALYYELQYQVIELRGIHYTINVGSNTTNHPNTLASDSAKIKIVQNDKKEQQVSQPEFSFASVLAGSTQQILIPVNTQFSITIPKIGASARVFPNVDPDDPSVYLPVLAKGIAHAKGSVFPGMQGNIYLFAHSTDNWWDVGRYNAVFYLLKDLSIGDSVIVFFENKRYDYTVSKTVITDPTDVSLLTRGQVGDQRLVLQTCWPPGTTWKRLYVIAVPKKT